MKILVIVVVCLALGIGIGVGAAFALGDKGMYDEYLKNYGMAGGMGGLVVGAIIAQRMAKKK